MNKEKPNFIKNELEGIKDIAIDLLPRLTDLLNPTVWQSQEQIAAALGNIGASFVGNRIKKWLEEMFNNKAEIDETVADSEKSQQVFLDLIKFVAKENPDVETWEAAKKIFLRTLEKDIEEQKRVSLYELLIICQELSGTEIKILAGAYKLYQEYRKSQGAGQHNIVGVWARMVANNIGLKTREEVLRYEDQLVNQKLISARENFNGSIKYTWDIINESNESSSTHRLTPLGLRLAEFFINS